MGDQFEWGENLTGSWNTPSNWIDETTGADPATVAPGANDDVSIGGWSDGMPISLGNGALVTGTGASNILTLAGVELAGDFSTGALTDAGSLVIESGADLIVSGGLINAGPGLSGDSYTVDSGAMFVIGGGVSVATDSEIAATYTVSGGSLFVAGTLTASSYFENDVYATSGGVVQLGGVSATEGGVELSADATSSIEIGAAGGALAGSVTLDAGVTTNISGKLFAPSLIINGTLIDNAALGLWATSQGNGLSGSGQIQIDAGAELNVSTTVSSTSVPTIDFAGAGGSLSLSTTSLSTSGEFLPTIIGFNSTDTINWGGSTLITNANYANGVLSLLDGLTVVAELKLSGNYVGKTFSVLNSLQINILEQGDTSTAPAGTASEDQFDWGENVAGSWDAAANWVDTTADSNPASLAPGANDDVTIAGSLIGEALVTGTGASKSLTLGGSEELAGHFSTGDVTGEGFITVGAGDDLLVSGGLVNTGLDECTYTVDAGAVLSIGGGVSSNTNVGATFTVSGGSLLVAGTLTDLDPYENDDYAVYAINGGAVQLGGLYATAAGLGVKLGADATSSIEIGAAGGALAGSITLDAGVTTSISGTLLAPSLIINGALIDNGGVNLRQGVQLANGNGQSTSLGGGLSGSGQIEIDADAELGLASTAISSTSAPTIDFAGASGMLSLSTTSLDASGGFLPTIIGFNSTDTIEWSDPTVNITSAGYGNGVLTLLNGTTAVAELNLSGNYSADTFNVTNDNVSVSGATVSVSVPTVTLSAGEASGQASQTITGAVTSSTANVAGQMVTLFDNGVALTTSAPILVQSNGSFSGSIVLPSAGVNAIVATVVDSMGVLGTSATLDDWLTATGSTNSSNADQLSVNVGDGVNFTIGGAGDYLDVTGTGAVATATGSKDDIALAGLNDWAALNGAGEAETATGSGGYVLMNGASDNSAMNGPSEAASASSTGADDYFSLGGSNDWVTMYGASDGATATGADVSVTQGGSGDWASLTGQGDAMTATGSKASATLGGSSEWATLNGSGDAGTATGATDYVVLGSSDEWVALKGAGDSVTGSGNGDYVEFGGSSAAANLTGNTESYVFDASFGNVVISGFNATDTVQFSKSDFASWAALSSAAHLSQGATGAVITFNAADAVILTGVSVNSLVAANFHFA